jgi:predicted  nucleic acid-binding Zn-ribbon protein
MTVLALPIAYEYEGLTLAEQIEELERDVEHERERGDIQYDRAEKLMEERDELKDKVTALESDLEDAKTDLEDFRNENANLATMSELVEELGLCYERLELGVLSEGARIKEIIRELRGVVRV